MRFKEFCKLLEDATTDVANAQQQLSQIDQAINNLDVRYAQQKKPLLARKQQIEKLIAAKKRLAGQQATQQAAQNNQTLQSTQ